MLFVVSTPIGHLEDITLRALHTLRQVELILCEDTRTTMKLLRKYDIHTPIKSYHAFNEHRLLPSILQRLQAGEHIALVTDAGTPAVSDPGYLLLRACIEHDIPIDIVPGPSAFLIALLVSGFPPQPFHFEGFLPRRKGRKKRLEYLSQLPHTIVLYESPHRLQKCLAELVQHLGPDRHAAVCRELTKVHQQVVRNTLEALYEMVDQDEIPTKGEFTIVIGPK